MKIYFISQDKHSGYDTYDSAVVIAENEEEAKSIHPNGYDKVEEEGDYTWCGKEFVKVEYLGEAKEGSTKGVICASFNAG